MTEHGLYCCLNTQKKENCLKRFSFFYSGKNKNISKYNVYQYAILPILLETRKNKRDRNKKREEIKSEEGQ